MNIDTDDISSVSDAKMHSSEKKYGNTESPPNVSPETDKNTDGTVDIYFVQECEPKYHNRTPVRDKQTVKQNADDTEGKRQLMRERTALEAEKLEFREIMSGAADDVKNGLDTAAKIEEQARFAVAKTEAEALARVAEKDRTIKLLMEQLQEAQRSRNEILNKGTQEIARAVKEKEDAVRTAALEKEKKKEAECTAAAERKKAEEAERTAAAERKRKEEAQATAEQTREEKERITAAVEQAKKTQTEVFAKQSAEAQEVRRNAENKVKEETASSRTETMLVRKELATAIAEKD